MAEHSRIIKVAGWSFVGFCAVSVAADKLPVGLNTVQIAGFCGAFLGALAGRYRKGTRKVTDSGNAQPGNSSLPSESAQGPDTASTHPSESVPVPVHHEQN